MRRRPTLAVVCGTHHPGPVVAAALSPLHGWADEVIVGADDRVSDTELGWYHSVADRLVTFPFTGRNQFRGWLREQASSDWLLFIDGDEIVSDALINGIGPLLDDRVVAAHRVSMWWVAPNGTEVLDSKPWAPEYHCRLVRNDDRLYFPSVEHSGPETRGPQRRSSLPLLHLDLALNDFDTRREKVERYEAQHATQLADGRSVNSGYYLPEQVSGVRTRSMGEVDRERVATVLSSRDEASPGPRAFVVHERATSADVRRRIPWEPFPCLSG